MADIVDGDARGQVDVSPAFDVPDFRARCFLCENSVLGAYTASDSRLSPFQQLFVCTHLQRSLGVTLPSRFGPIC
jgi:hypothetical protein